MIPERISYFGGKKSSLLQLFVCRNRNSDQIHHILGAFHNCSNLVSIVIPENVTSIEESAFQDCTNLSTLTLGKNLKYIGNYAFQRCTKLPYVSFPKSLETVGIDAFEGCTNVSAVYITDLSAWIKISFDWDEDYGGTPNPLRYAHHLYVNGTLLSGNVIIPEGTTGIRRYIFDGCTDMTAITLPNSISVIGSNAFRECDNLSAVYITDLSAWCKIGFGDNPLRKARHLYINNAEVENLVIPNDIETISENAFLCYDALKSVEIPNNVKAIEGYAFADCKNLESVIIPKSVSQFGECIFLSCYNLKSISINNETPPSWIENNTFYDISSHVTLYVPYGSKAAYEAADYWKDFKEIIEIVPEPDMDISQMDNAIYIEPVEGLVGSTVDLCVKLKNTLTPVGCSFMLTLPNGLRLLKDEDGDVVYQLGSRAKKMSVTMQDRNDGSYNFSLTPSTGTATITGNEGTFITFHLQVPADAVADQAYPIKLTNNLLQTSEDGNLKDNELSDVLTTLFVYDYMPGDVNSDGRVTPSDAIMILYHYFGVEQSGFNVKAADLNGDGNISPADAIAALYLYFGTVNASRPADATQEPQ